MMIDVAGTWTQQLLDEGFDPETAVQRVQFLLWAIVGFFGAATNARAADVETLRRDAAAVEPDHQAGATIFLDHAAREDFDGLFALTVRATVHLFASDPPARRRRKR